MRTLANAFATGPHRPGLYADRACAASARRPPPASSRAPSIIRRRARRLDMPEMTRALRGHPRIAPYRRDRDGRRLQYRRRRCARDHRERALCAGLSARYKVYIIDEVHMLSKSAFNALLKTLEEPPPHVKFIFATTEIRKVPVTILSRCQRFDLRRLDADAARRASRARWPRPRRSRSRTRRCGMIARAAEGSVRDGLSLLDQAIAYGERRRQGGRACRRCWASSTASRVIDLFEAVMAGDAARAITEIERPACSRAAIRRRY